MKTAPFLIAALCALPASHAVAAVYTCTVEDFSTFSDNSKLAKANLARRFSVDIGRRTIDLLFLTDGKVTNTTTFKVSARGGTQQYATSTDEFATRTLALPRIPQEVLDRMGSFPVTFVRQSDLSVNVWKLRCGDT